MKIKLATQGRSHINAVSGRDFQCRFYVLNFVYYVNFLVKNGHMMIHTKKFSCFNAPSVILALLDYSIYIFLIVLRIKEKMPFQCTECDFSHKKFKILNSLFIHTTYVIEIVAYWPHQLRHIPF